MKKFKDYLSDIDKSYKFKLKLAVPDVDDKMLDVLEACLAKYELVSASPFRRTPIQEHPLDFPRINNTPVFISEIEIKYPSTTQFLETYIGNNLNVTSDCILVYLENDPRQVEADLFLARQDIAKESMLAKDGYEGEETEGQDHQEQSFGLLKDLEQARQERVIVQAESPLNPPETKSDVDPKFNQQLESESQPGLFGRLKVEKAYNYIKK